MKQKNRDSHKHTHIQAQVHVNSMTTTTKREPVTTNRVKRNETRSERSLSRFLKISIQINKTYTNGWRASVDINTLMSLQTHNRALVEINWISFGKTWAVVRTHFLRQNRMWICARASDHKGCVTAKFFLRISRSRFPLSQPASFCSRCISLRQNICPSSVYLCDICAHTHMACYICSSLSGGRVSNLYFTVIGHIHLINHVCRR